MQVTSQAGGLRLGEPGQHLLFKHADLVPVAVQEFPAAGGERDHQASAAGAVAVPHLALLMPDGKCACTATDHSGLTPDDVAFQPTPWQQTQYGTLPN